MVFSVSFSLLCKARASTSGTCKVRLRTDIRCNRKESVQRTETVVREEGKGAVEEGNTGHRAMGGLTDLRNTSMKPKVS